MRGWVGPVLFTALCVVASCSQKTAEMSIPFTEGQLADRADDPERVAAGRKLFSMYCIACHGLDGNAGPGMVGADLTDGQWIHGGNPHAVYRTIAVGVVSKGMTSWRHLGDERLADLTAFVLSLQQR